MSSAGLSTLKREKSFDILGLDPDYKYPAISPDRDSMAMFRRRNTIVPDIWPVGLTLEFAGDVVKRRQWDAFLEKSRVAGPALAEAIDAIRHLLSEPLKLAQTS